VTAVAAHLQSGYLIYGTSVCNDECVTCDVRMQAKRKRFKHLLYIWRAETWY